MNADEQQPEVVHAIKGFNRDMTCRGFQFAEGQTYEHPGPVQVCESGFHAVTQPIDVFHYYPPARSVYHEVEMQDVETHGDDSKVAGRIIKVGARIELPALIKAQIDFVFANAKRVSGATSKKKNAAVKAEVEHGAATASGYSGAATASGYSGAATASGYYGAATASGDSGTATASGYSGAATASGDSGAATASGYYGAATASGDSGAATASGYSGAATASGYYGAATASGDSGAATASGYYGAATASGDSGAATASGEKSIAVAAGRDGKASGALGTWIVLTERDADWNILGVKAVRVDGEKVRADVFYTLRDGKVVKA